MRNFIMRICNLRWWRH